jgi:hypothetical protein
MQWLPVAAIAAGLSSCKKEQDVAPVNTQPGVYLNVKDEVANNAPDTIITLSGNRLSAEAVTKTQIATVGSTIIYNIAGQNAFFFNAGMNVAAEGAPKAFNQNDAIALDYLSKAGQPGNWWSLVTNDGKPSGTPLIQPSSEPAPGYYISTTALTNSGYSAQSVWCYVNASSVPYIALPPSLASKARIGDFAAVINKKTGAVSYAIFADVSGEGSVGRASINAASKTGINNSPKTGGTTASDLIYIVFPNTGNGYGRSLKDIKQNGRQLLREFGGGRFLLNLFNVTSTTPPPSTATPPTVSITAPANNGSFTAPASVTISADASDADGSITKVEFYNGTTLLASDTTSPYSLSWTVATAGNYSITAKATDNSGATTTSAAVAITVKAPTSTPPTVSITSPVNNATYTSPASITISATAADADGTVSKVDFYNGTTLLGTDATSPYSFNWINVATGNYVITAKATDNTSLAVMSAGISIVVKAPVPPTVSITAPANNATYTSPASVSITANAADADGTVSKVDYYNGTSFIGSSAVSPYSFNWTNVGGGTYTITAKATDNSGSVSTSSPVMITVNNPIPSPITSGFRTIGYLADWSGNVNQIQYSKLTHINYSFINTTASGSLSLGISTSRLSSVVSLAHAQGTKVCISIGGWNNGDDSNFESMAASSTATNTFINNVINFVSTYNLDGADIDWEYPNTGSSATNYANLMKALSAALHAKGKTLSAAVVSDGSGGAGVLSEVFGYVDMLNVMAYDGGTPHSPYSLAVSSITYWTGRGCPTGKIMLGLPFYGKDPETAYNTLVAQDPTAPNKDQIGTVYYNGIKTIQDKTRLAMQQAGGVMIWELSQDATGSASLLTAINNVVLGLAFTIPLNDTKEQSKFYFENTLASEHAGTARTDMFNSLGSAIMNESREKRRNSPLTHSLV